jgi:hypothetical protein
MQARHCCYYSDKTYGSESPAHYVSVTQVAVSLSSERHSTGTLLAAITREAGFFSSAVGLGSQLLETL